MVGLVFLKQQFLNMISSEYSAAKSDKASVSHFRRQNPWHIIQDSNGKKRIQWSSHGKSLKCLMKNSRQSNLGLFVYLGEREEKHNISLIREI